MGDGPADPNRLKADQRDQWDAVAAGWGKWWPTIEAGSRPVGERLLDLAEVAPGARVLDVATGIGEPAVSAAQRVGPGGRVIATDLSPGMLAIARQRAAEKGLANIAFRQGDAETLELPEDPFDAVLCRWGLMFMPEPARALERMRACLAPGGRLAVAVWSSPEKVPFLSLPGAAVRQALGLPAPDPGAPGPFRLAETGTLERLVEGAGFREVRRETVTVTMELASVEAYLAFLQDVAGAIRALLAGETPERRRQALARVAEAVTPHVTPEGSLRFSNEAICVTAC